MCVSCDGRQHDRNGTQHDLNKMVNMVKIWGQKDRPDVENEGTMYKIISKL